MIFDSFTISPGKINFPSSNHFNHKSSINLLSVMQVELLKAHPAQMREVY